MEIKELTENVEVVQTLGTYPNQEDGLTPEELKAKFDEGCRIIKEYLNRVIVPGIRGIVNDDSVTTGAWTAKKILEMIAQGGTRDIDMQGRDIKGVAQLSIGDSADDKGFTIIPHGQHDADDAQIAEFSGVVDGEAVRIRNVAPGVHEFDAATVGQLMAAQLATDEKKIIDKLCQTFAKTGSVVRCEPVDGYPLKVISKVGPSLSGHDTIILTQLGKNLYDKDAFPLMQGAVMIGTGGSAASAGYCRTDEYIPVTHLRGQTITLNHPPKETGGGNPGAAFYDARRGYIRGVNDYTMTIPENAVYMRFSVPLKYLDGNDVQLELGSSVTDYAHYEHKNYVAELGDYYWGAEFDWQTGLLTVTHEKVDMASLDWQYSEENCYFYADLADGAVPDVGKANDAISNAFTWEPDTYGDITSGGVLHGGFFDISDEDGICRIAVACWDADTVGTFLDILAGTDAMLVYPLAQPITLECGARIIAAKSGTNTLYSSTGDTQVAGRADPVAQTKHLEERIAALEAAITNL